MQWCLGGVLQSPPNPVADLGGGNCPPPFLGIGVRKILEIIGLFMYTVVNSAVYTTYTVYSYTRLAIVMWY